MIIIIDYSYSYSYGVFIKRQFSNDSKALLSNHNEFQLLVGFAEQVRF